MVSDTQENGSNAVEGDTKTDSDILLPETNEYEACYFD
jgi:hypothetical protein